MRQYLNKIKFPVVILVFLLGLSGCGTEYSGGYEIAIFQSQEYKGKTKFLFYDEQLQNTGEITYSYPNIGYDGFCNSLIEDGKLFLLPKGNAKKLDYGKVISLSLENGKIDEYDLNRTNITDYDYEANKIYTASNLNGVSYIDCCDMETKEVQNYENNEYILETVVVGGDELYGIGMALETNEYIIAHIELENQSCKELYRGQFEEMPSYLEYYDGRLYFVENNMLCEYQIEEKNIKKYELPHADAFNLLMQEGKLYIGYTELYEDSACYVDVFDTTTGEMKTLIETDKAILQMEVGGTDGDIIYLLNYESLVKYRVTDGKGVKDGEIKLPDEEDFYIGGFFEKK